MLYLYKSMGPYLHWISMFRIMCTPRLLMADVMIKVKWKRLNKRMRSQFVLKSYNWTWLILPISCSLRVMIFSSPSHTRVCVWKFSTLAIVLYFSFTIAQHSMAALRFTFTYETLRLLFSHSVSLKFPLYFI